MGSFELLGYVGAAVNIVTYSMRTMIPLRIMAIASNCIFIVYRVLAASIRSWSSMPSSCR